MSTSPIAELATGRQQQATADTLSRWERLGLVGFVVVILLFGALVEVRSAFLKRHMTDLQVYLRAAWAVRNDADIYTITDDNGWHYHYPPLFAILLTPLADPPLSTQPSVPAMFGYLPFGLSVIIWYFFSIGCVFLSVHLLANALERTSANISIRGQHQGSRRWWALRLFPLFICLPSVGHTLMRGQVNLLLLALLCGMVAAILQNRSWQAGWWLAGAICLKIIPAFLLLYPLWRRDGRCLASCAIGLGVGFALIPAAVFGTSRTIEYYQEWTQVLVRPAMGQGNDASRAKELIDITATDSQSFMAMLHNSLHSNPATRPPQPTEFVRATHWFLGGLLTIVVLLVSGRHCRDQSGEEVVFLGSLILLMILLSPVCHLHYFCLTIPLIMGLLVLTWEKQKTLHLGYGWFVLIAVNLIANSLPHFRELQVLRDVGLASYAALLLWSVGTFHLLATGSSCMAGSTRSKRARSLLTIPHEANSFP